jgi:hypothetical protein
MINNIMDLIEILKNYTRNEVPIYSEEVFEELRNMFPNEEDMIVYRGINFDTKEDYESFLNDLKENNGYISDNCAGFSPSYNTAYDFSTTTKTYFPTLEVMQSSARRRLLKEKISGYRGVILKSKVKKGEVIDVRESGVGIESEVLFAPNKLIECEIEIIKPFRELVEEKDFCVNDYIKNTEDFNDPLAQYIFENKSSLINEEVKDLLVERKINDFNKHRDYKITEIENEKIILNEENVIAFTRKNYKFGEESETIIYFLAPNFYILDKFNLLDKKQKEKIEPLVESIIMEVLDIHIKYRDKYKINYEGVTNLTGYISEETRELYTRAIGYGKRQSYEDINERLRFIMNSGKFQGNKSQEISNEIEKLNELFRNFNNVLPKDSKIIEKEKMEKEKNKRKELGLK